VVTEPVRMPADRLHRQIVGVLTAWGMPPGPAAATADVIVDTDLSGIDSHGVSMLPTYEQLHRAGRLDLAAEPVVVRDLPAVAVVDGRHGLGHPIGVFGIDLAVRKARAAGIGAVSVGASNHFGALGYYVRRAVEQGVVALVTSTTRVPAVAPTGGRTPVLGTNPIAFAAPRTGGAPLVVDMSTSVVAVNKVKAHWLNALGLPAGWVFGRDGEPLTDAEDAFRRLTTADATLAPLGGAGTALGGHKGYGLSLVVQVLSAALSNAAAPGHGGDHDDIGHFFLAIDPELVNPDGRTADNVDALCRSVQAADPDVLIPGQPEERARADRGARGIPLGPTLRAQLADLCRNAPTAVDPLLAG
jgi:LDH2 family malate/lactate/ureidoglycolate dehydrogenase